MSLAMHGSDNNKIKGVCQLVLIFLLELDPKPTALAGLVGAARRLDHYAFSTIRKCLLEICFNFRDIRGDNVLGQANQAIFLGAVAECFTPLKQWLTEQASIFYKKSKPARS